ncbi:MAG: glycosyltransferase [Patescibacteria group bacterium]
MKIEICLPVYNEEKILESNILKVLDYLGREIFFQDKDWRLLVIVNGSNDQSAQITRDLCLRFPEKIQSLEFKLGGKGRSLKHYFLLSQAEVLVYMDIDLAVDLKALPALLQPILSNEADLVFASRLLSGSKTDRSWYRTLSSYIFNALSRLLLGHRFSDSQCGFKAFKNEVFRSVAQEILDDHWFFDTELLVFSARQGWRLQEIPVDWREERYQARPSKVKFFRDSFKFLTNLLKLKKRLLKASSGLKS